MAELNTVSLSDFVKNAEIIWLKAQMETPAVFRSSGLCKVTPIPSNSGNTREFSEVDSNEYLSYKGEGDQAVRGQVQQGYTNTMTAVRQANNLAITWEINFVSPILATVCKKLLNCGKLLFERTIRSQINEIKKIVERFNDYNRAPYSIYGEGIV